jgi:hypothetical protein
MSSRKTFDFTCLDCKEPFKAARQTAKRCKKCREKKSKTYLDNYKNASTSVDPVKRAEARSIRLLALEMANKTIQPGDRAADVITRASEFVRFYYKGNII